MDLALLIGRLLLAGVFAVAGIAKLLDREGSREALVGFGLPARIARPAAILLPVAELAVALALLPLATAFWGGIGALVLLGLFVIGIALSMARGEAPDCHCFGQIHSEPAGWRTLIRNGALALVAVFVVAPGGSEPGASLTGWIGELSGTEQIGLFAIVVIAVMLAAQAWFLFQLMAQNGRLLTRIEQLEAGIPPSADQGQDPAQPNLPAVGLPVGSPAPPFSLSGLYGETITLDAVLAPGKPALLLFTDPKCVPCNALLPEIARWQREHAGSMTTVVISRREVAENLPKAREHDITTVLVQENFEVYEAYQAKGTPSAVLVQPDGVIGSPVAGGARQIEQLVDWVLQRARGAAPGQSDAVPSTNGARPSPAASRPSQPPAAPLTAMATGGQSVPRIVLSDADGGKVDLSNRGDRPTVVLFWNPGCGFCKRMVDDLAIWDSSRPDGAPDLLIISSAGVDDERVMALGVPYLLDNGFAASRQLGASGTPSAVLLSGDGKIASNVMVGADNVMGLLDPARRVAPTNGNGAQQPLAPLVRMGSPAPEFELSDLDGNEITSSSLIGEETLVLFWDPSCGFCRQMTDELQALEADVNVPRMLVVSTGVVQVNRELGLESTIVLDQGFSLGRQFGASGTPSAVLVDRKGRIASTVAAGAPAILDLARSASSSAPA